VYVYPADLGGCGYYRLIWPAKELQRQGHDVRLLHPDAKHKISGGLDDSGKLVSVSVPKDADVVVFQRVSSRRMIEAIKILRAHGIAVVVDIDDDMSAIDQRNPAWAALHPKGTAANEEYDWNAARAVCDGATLVTVSTDALFKRYVVHGRGMVLRNAVPELFLTFDHEDKQIIGWAGALFSHPDDPQVCGPAMGRLQREGYLFKVVGPIHGTKSAFQLDHDPLSTGPLQVERWPAEVNKLGIGIAPLNDTRFNAAKSWLKPLEYAALGVPCVSSPRDEYRRLHALGVGLLATTPKDWYRHVKMLAENASARAELSERGRVAVNELTIEKNAWRWAEAWTRAFEIERGPLGLKPSDRTISA
jgi:hypothetical protein